MGSFVSSARFGDDVAASTAALPHIGGDAGPGGRELLGLGLAISVAVLLPMFAGIGADVLLHTSPFGLLIGLALGIAAASITVFQRFKPYL
jgi:hypothetical protein